MNIINFFTNNIINTLTSGLIQ